MEAPSKSSEGVLVDIPPGTSVPTIAKRLKEKRLIRSELAFQWVVRVMGESENIKAGEYRIPQNLGVVQVIDRLVTGRAEAVWLVIPEGKRVSEVAVLVDERGLGEGRDAFVASANRNPSRFGVEIATRRRSVEGYLMPDTYRFPRGTTNRDVITAMLKNWNKKIYEPHASLFRQSDLSVDEIVVAASLIEREARVDEDRALISSVIRNRLAKKMRLEIDATVIYALGYHKNELSLADLKVDHAANTYRNVGLPPTPICSPGEKSILAALKPANTNYLFYVAKPDGSHLFATDYEKHKANIAAAKAMKPPAAE